MHDHLLTHNDDYLKHLAAAVPACSTRVRGALKVPEVDTTTRRRRRREAKGKARSDGGEVDDGEG